MKRNVGRTDRMIRSLVAVILLAFFAEADHTRAINWLWLAGAFVMMITAISSYCPLYQILNISTYRAKKEEASKHLF